MSRPLRVEYVGACYHVINRGNYRRNLFEGGGAAEAFERTLGEVRAKETPTWCAEVGKVFEQKEVLLLELGEARRFRVGQPIA